MRGFILAIVIGTIAAVIYGVIFFIKCQKDKKNGNYWYTDMVNSVNEKQAPKSDADELAKFKRLLDEGVITQAEFDKKKAQILK